MKASTASTNSPPFKQEKHDQEDLVEDVDGLVIITINRPEQQCDHCAVSYGVWEAIDEMDRNPQLRDGIVAGAAGTFCAGMDLKAYLRGEVMRVEGRGVLGIARTSVAEAADRRRGRLWDCLRF